ncbi:MAG: 16S rRNA (cytosine(1402)-N(4))-methyltransferase RsmH [Victivallaceae bacterium]
MSDEIEDQPAEHRRRLRYRGTHPRRFEEKYKELNGQEIDKIIRSGKTPAGMHRSICVEEIIAALELQPGMVGVDATFGYGGHSQAILKHITPGGLLYSIDVDALELAKSLARLRAAGFGEDVLQVRQLNFAGIARLLAEQEQGFDFVLADLGVSSMQIDNPERGFSFKRPGPLDLRLNSKRGATGRDVLRKMSEPAIEKMLRINADEPFAAEIAAVLFAKREKIETTLDYADAIRHSLNRKPLDPEELKDTLQRCFQALRIAVNDEFSALDSLLNSLPLVLKSGGRVAILSFHSGEDRRVKHAFKDGFANGVYQAIGGPIRASARERFENPRSKCAILRTARLA